MFGFPMALRAYRQALIVNVMVTTACDRRCPSCCCRDVVHGQKARHFTPEGIAADIIALGDVAFVTLTGGEPTTHPEFSAVAQAARKARGQLPLHLVTNGFCLVEKAAAMAAFDVVSLTVFSDPLDPEIAKTFQTVCPPGVRVHARCVTHRHQALGAQPCGRHYRSASVMDGLIYPCCVSCGIAGAEATSLTPGWEVRLLALRPPCGRCVLGAEVDPFGLCHLEE